MASYEPPKLGDLIMSSYKYSIEIYKYSFVTLASSSLPLIFILIEFLLQEYSLAWSWFRIQLCYTFLLTKEQFHCYVSILVKVDKIYKNYLFKYIPLGEIFTTFTGKGFLVNL